MNIQKTKKAMLKEKEAELLRYQVMEKYLVQRIEDNEETTKRQELIDARRITQELENQIEFLKQK